MMSAFIARVVAQRLPPETPGQLQSHKARLTNDSYRLTAKRRDRLDGQESWFYLLTLFNLYFSFPICSPNDTPINLECRAENMPYDPSFSLPRSTAAIGGKRY
jgi:hypothetical protein